MDYPGKRYRTLADRCRQSAIAAPSEANRSALLKMARGYDRRALEYETDAACA